MLPQYIRWTEDDERAADEAWRAVLREDGAAAKPSKKALQKHLNKIVRLKPTAKRQAPRKQ